MSKDPNQQSPGTDTGEGPMSVPDGTIIAHGEGPSRDEVAIADSTAKHGVRIVKGAKHKRT